MTRKRRLRTAGKFRRNGPRRMDGAELMATGATIRRSSMSGSARSPRISLHNRPSGPGTRDTLLLDEQGDALARADCGIRPVKAIIIGGTGDHSSPDTTSRRAWRAQGPIASSSAGSMRPAAISAMRETFWGCPQADHRPVQGACVAGGFPWSPTCAPVVAADDAFSPSGLAVAGCAPSRSDPPLGNGPAQAKEFLLPRRGECCRGSQGSRSAMVIRCTRELESATLALAEKIAEGPAFDLPA